MCRCDLCDTGAKWAPRDTAFPPAALQFPTKVGSLWLLSVDGSPCHVPFRHAAGMLLSSATGSSPLSAPTDSSPLSTPLPIFVSKPLGLLHDLQSSLILVVFHNSQVFTLQIMGKTLTFKSDN